MAGIQTSSGVMTMFFITKHRHEKETDRLRDDIRRLNDSNATIAKQHQDARELISELRADLASLKKDNQKISKLVREQTEADLLINALKAVGIIKDDAEKQPDRFAEQGRLNEQLQRALGPSALQSGRGEAGGVLGSLGNAILGPGRWI